jgi:hypothetical protein
MKAAGAGRLRPFSVREWSEIKQEFLSCFVSGRFRWVMRAIYEATQGEYAATLQPSITQDSAPKRGGSFRHISIRSKIATSLKLLD